MCGVCAFNCVFLCIHDCVCGVYSLRLHLGDMRTLHMSPRRKSHLSYKGGWGNGSQERLSASLPRLAGHSDGRVLCGACDWLSRRGFNRFQLQGVGW